MPQAFRIIFMGTPDFAVPTLQKLVENQYPVVAVITAPDKPAGRGLKLTHSPVKEFALSQGIPVLQPTNLKSEAFQEELRSYQANLQIIVAFRMLPEAVWSMPALGTFNIHASLLPDYRGAAPINWALINGEKETGVTSFFLRHQIDTGDILLQEKIIIQEEDDFGSLYDKLKHLGADVALKTVRAIEAGNVQPQPQPQSIELKEAPKLFKETCAINWQQSAGQIQNFVRGLSPFPGAWTLINDKIVKIYRAKVLPELSAEEEPQEPGSYRTDNKKYLHFYTGQGILSITDLQLEGKKRMHIDELLRGYKF
ncbi:methionyl-tRNA formyltransferase [Adhaeribacter arboris]|uniref:Methionyl-tRNA formyltransferase n=1 Tax=Adhaeribacter arboris TaxID=2072846 RepID=A0A2T2YFC9_9BACT|nr:methionyl-tRNA formyltransferase [Adhaeribacter arboris]PSR54219.1 methionyl-tRNA formyltransferase [Adhaeribacter arboris]